MRQHAQAAAPATAFARAEINWQQADDTTLVRGMIQKNDLAWLEFLGRFDQLLTDRVQSTLRKRSRSLQSTEFIATVKGDVHELLREYNMRPLRGFDERHGALAEWVGRLAEQMTIRRLFLLTNLDDEGAAGAS